MEKINTKYLIIIASILLFVISISTFYYGYIDIKDYTDTAKFFANEYNAKLRTAHSVSYSLLHVPFVKMTNSFIIFKLTSVLFLILIILSLYQISNKDKKTLFLFLISPIIWYMAPWVNSIQLSSLLFLWAYYFIKKYEQKEKLKYLLFSGLLLGVSWLFWDAVIYFSFILALAFLYNKKLSSSIFFILAFFLASIPRFIIDQLLFNFAFYSFIKHFFALASFALYGGAYGQVKESIFHFSNIISSLIILPFFTFLIFSRKNFLKEKKSIIFLILALIIVLFNNAEIRYLTMIYPIIILILAKNLSQKQFKIQAIIFLILSLIIINSYLIAIKYETNFTDFNYLIKNFPNYQIKEIDNSIKNNIYSIANDYPNQAFIVGNGYDDYNILAGFYWGKQVKEFISIQDYELFLANKTAIAGKSICSYSKPWNRRDICFSVELRKAINDNTDYNSIKYAISFEKNLSLGNFKLIKEYDSLFLFEKI